MIGVAEIRNAKVLIVDDKEDNIRLLERTLLAEGYVSIEATSESREVCALHARNRYDLILLDLVMPDFDGFEVMEALKSVEVDSYLPVLVITAEPGHKLRALKAGAKDFVSKPLDLAEVCMRIHNMIEVRLLHMESRTLYQQLLHERDVQVELESALQDALTKNVHSADEPLGIVARSAAMRRILDLGRRVAKVDSTVLITGESGSGKERIARLLHEESNRSGGPFVAINCGAIAETLLESELFGHARGAFSGATQDRPGLFEAADGGTLLLDEIGEIPASMQVKLLRTLQEREIRRVGENKNRSVDVRIVVATNRDLAQEVANGNFRQDLFYRMNVVSLEVPPLRERRDDILPLARVLLSEAASRMKRKISGIAPDAADRLLRYAWPGNVRELENAMERAVALALGPLVGLDDLPDEVRSVLVDPGVPLGSVRPLEVVEKEYILASLERNGGNQTRTAEQLRIGSATLYRKLKSYGMIADKRPGPADMFSEEKEADRLQDRI